MKAKRPMMTIEMAEEYRLEIKQLALRRNIPLRTWVMRAIEEYRLKETQYDRNHDDKNNVRS